MPLENIHNPFLQLPEMRTSGRAQLAHAGNRPELGAGRPMGISIVSPVEFLFRETAEGVRARGTQQLRNFYDIHQNVTSTKIWSFLPDRGWQSPHVTGLENDDPVDTMELAMSYQASPAPALISFYDSPGFLLPPHASAGVDSGSVKVFLLQSFQVWCDVNRRFSRGAFQASPARFWNNLICVRRDNASAVAWTVTSAALISGRAIVDRPLCD